MGEVGYLDAQTSGKANLRDVGVMPTTSWQYCTVLRYLTYLGKVLSSDTCTITKEDKLHIDICH